MALQFPKNIHSETTNITICERTVVMRCRSLTVFFGAEGELAIATDDGRKMLFGGNGRVIPVESFSDDIERAVRFACEWRYSEPTSLPVAQ